MPNFSFTRRDLFALSAAAAVPSVPRLEYLTPLERAARYILDKTKTGAAKMTPAELHAARLLPETWSLDVVADTGSDIGRPVSLDWSGLMRLAEKHAVRFLHVCTCTNGADPFNMSLWEGVPLREVIWLTGPKGNIRRAYYQSYHAPGVPPFQASLPMGQILETPPGRMPVILAYKMNGQIIPAANGGPVRVVVPGAYGNKLIKWVQRIVLTNDYKANDSDAELNNDTETALKTRARFIDPPKEAAAGQPILLTGMAQIGISGLGKVQYSAGEADEWRDAQILPPPTDWGGGIPEGRLPRDAHRIGADGRPVEWPIRYTLAHWCAQLDGLKPGRYDLACRTIDGNGIAQPMPRPFLRTGFNAIHRVSLTVRA